jgi:regulator of PEP synthase PpsR (kinase-PPPase family)
MSIEQKKNLKVIVISDGIGDTATEMTRAAITQFADKEIFFTRFKNVRTKEHIDAIFSDAANKHDLIVYTIVSPDLRNHVRESSKIC